MANKSQARLKGPLIWCLFSVSQEYDQPDNNLVAWWAEKPSLEELFSLFSVKMGEDERQTVAVVKVFIGGDEEVGFNNTRYRLEQIGEGKLDG
jgi:hypothetical protein